MRTRHLSLIFMLIASLMAINLSAQEAEVTPVSFIESTETVVLTETTPEASIVPAIPTENTTPIVEESTSVFTEVPPTPLPIVGEETASPEQTETPTEFPITATPDPLNLVLQATFDTETPDLLQTGEWLPVTTEAGIALQSSGVLSSLQYRYAYQDVAVQVRLLLHTGAFTLHLRHSAFAENNSSYAITLNASGEVNLFREGSLVQTVAEKIDPDVWVTVEARAIAGQIIITIDGIPVLHYEDTLPLGSGGILMVAEQDALLRLEEVVILAQGEATLFMPVQASISTPIPTENPYSCCNHPYARATKKPPHGAIANGKHSQRAI